MHQIICTNNIGGYVAAITWNLKTHEASIAHLMIKAADVIGYQTWFEGLNLNSEDLCIALVGGSNTVFNNQDSIRNSRELLAALKHFFDAKGLSIHYEDLYADNVQMLKNGQPAITHEKLEESIKEINLNALIQLTFQLLGRLTP